jgi:tubulin polyglutamylase TTLL6/13
MDSKGFSTRSVKLVCNISSTKYEVVRHVAKKMLGWKLSHDEESDDWDVFWTDSAVQPEKLAKMKHFQRINHFPGMYLISRKNYLAFNLGKLRKLFPDAYNFFPKTWVVPCDLSDLKFFMQSKKNPYVIVKPEASCQGRGIYITKKIEEIDPEERHVVQEYLTKPYLIEGLKFDLRIYVLVTSCDPLRIFVHEEGLTRFATEEYEKPSASNIEDMCMHLTNYAINKHNPNFVQNEDPDCDNVGHKRSLKSTYDLLEEEGYDVSKLKTRIDDMIIKTLCAIQPNLCHHYRSCQPEDHARSMCFEILGLDVIIDKKLNPFILEVNHTPSFSTDSPLDRTIKKTVISEALTLVRVSLSNRKKYFKKQKEELIKRSLTGKMDRMTKEEREVVVNKLGVKKTRFEAKHCGGYRKIYPVDGFEKYNQYIEAADNLWQEWTGAKILRTKKTELKSPMPPRPVKTCANITKSKRNMVAKRVSESEVSERPASSIFERLAQPIIRKFRSTTVSYLPGVIYDEKKEVKIETPMVVTGEEKVTVRQRTSSENKYSPQARPTQRQIAMTLKELLTGRPNAVNKNRYLDFLLRYNR